MGVMRHLREPAGNEQSAVAVKGEPGAEMDSDGSGGADRAFSLGHEQAGDPLAAGGGVDREAGQIGAVRFRRPKDGSNDSPLFRDRAAAAAQVFSDRLGGDPESGGGRVQRYRLGGEGAADKRRDGLGIVRAHGAEFDMCGSHGPDGSSGGTPRLSWANA